MAASRFAGLRLRLTALLRARQLEKDLDDELAFHLAMREADLHTAGADPHDAPSAARRRFGNVVALKEACRELWTFGAFEQLIRDLRYAFRTLGHDRAFTTVAVLTLALGIGATTAVSALLDAALFRPLPVPDPERLALLSWSGARGDVSQGGGVVEGCPGSAECALSYALYDAVTGGGEMRSLRGIAAFSNPQEVQLAVQGESAIAAAQFVSGNFFPILGLAPRLGRLLVPEDDHGGGTPAVVISHDYWRRRFGADPGVVGRTLVVNGAALTVTGVASSGFFGPDPAKPVALWLTLHTAQALKPGSLFFSPAHLLGRGRFLGAIARVAPEASFDQARDDLRLRLREALRALPDPPFLANDEADVALTPAGRGLNALRTGYGHALTALRYLAAVVLVVACANVVSLLLARSLARRREMAVRLAIGAGRARLFAQLFTEGLLLSSLGAAGGLLLGFWGSRFLAVALSPQLPPDALVWTHPSIVLIAGTVALVWVLTIPFALVPAWVAGRVAPASDLQSNRALGFSGRFSGSRLAHAIVAFEIAGALVLLVGAALLVRTIAHHTAFDPGFRTDHLLTVAVEPVLSAAAPTDVSADVEAARQRLAAVPGVAAATWASVPLIGNGHVQAGGLMLPTGADTVPWYYVGPRFFGTLGIPLLAGRDVGTADMGAGDTGVWISRSLAERYYPGRNPVGEPIRLTDGGRPHSIVGLVGDVLRGGPDAWRAAVYLPDQARARTFLLRTTVEPLSLAAAVRAAVPAASPRLLVQGLRDEAQRVREETTAERLLAAFSLGLGALALILAAVGIYGVLSYTVSRRRSEIAIRMALGAIRPDVLRLVLKDGGQVLLAGLAVGLPGAYGVSRILSRFLQGVPLLDTWSYVGAALVVVLVAAVASYLPAHRASRLDPASALRTE